MLERDKKYIATVIFGEVFGRLKLVGRTETCVQIVSVYLLERLSTILEWGPEAGSY
jgi:hypothetical protein